MQKKILIGSSVLRDFPLMKADIPRAVTRINREPDYTSYHLLRSLQTNHRDIYEMISAKNKAAILCSTLAKCYFVNDFSFLSPESCRDSESGKSIIGLGEISLGFLRTDIG